MTSDDARPVVLITGGSEGIGYELAKCFARDGHPLILVARDGARLQAVADELAAAHRIVVHTVVHDLSVPDAGPALFAEIGRRALRVDVLVNNAGVGFVGEFAKLPLERELIMLRLNIESLVTLTKLFLPAMLARGSGGILNVGSTAGYVPSPLMSVYYASKAFVLSFTEALGNELRGSGVRVSVLCPGPTRTRFQDKSGAGNRPVHRGVMTAQAVAAEGYAGFQAGRVTVIPGWRNRVLIFATRFLSRSFVAGRVRALQERRLATGR